MGTVLGERIRNATAWRHRALEESLCLTSPGITINSHLELLKKFYGFIAAWEPAIDNHFSDWYRPRRKLLLLEGDLHALGLSVLDVQCIPLCTEMPVIDNSLDALGSLYVIEGATLGGQIISRHLERVLELRDGKGYSYYRAYAEQTGSRWREFQMLLEQHSGPEADARIIAAADSTFAAMQRWLAPEQAGPAGDRS